MTCDTENKELEEAFTFFMMEIQPKAQPYADKLNKNLSAVLLQKNLISKSFYIPAHSKKNIDLFREENIPILAEMSVMQQQYGVIAGKMTIEVDGKNTHYNKHAKFLENNDRKLRESVYRKVGDRRLKDKESLNKLFSSLVEKRHRIAVNAGFANYRDYKFAEMGRFDYKPEDCFQFHQAVKEKYYRW